MKRILFALSLIFLMSFNKIDNLTSADLSNKKSELLRKKHIDVTLTATNGCTVHIIGDVYFTIIPPSFDGFIGTATIGGPGGCPHITLPFNTTSIKTGELTNLFDNEDICQLTTVSWEYDGVENVEPVLNDANVNNGLVQAIKDGDCN